MPKKRPRFKMRNQIKAEVEKEILDFVRDCPAYEPGRIAHELRRITSARISYTSGGIYNVLKRNGLNRRLGRLLYAKERGNGIFTEFLAKTLQKKRENHLETSHSGDVLSQGAKLVG